MNGADRARAALAAVTDPELPDLGVIDLGIVRAVDADPDGDRVEVVVTPTFSACPAMAEIRRDIERALSAAGFGEVVISVRLDPPWSSEWISAAGRERLQAAGIAPPTGGRGDGVLQIGSPPVACPQCGSRRTVLLSEFAATACRSLRRCEDCREPFDAIKAV